MLGYCVELKHIELGTIVEDDLEKCQNLNSESIKSLDLQSSLFCN